MLQFSPDNLSAQAMTPVFYPSADKKQRVPRCFLSFLSVLCCVVLGTSTLPFYGKTQAAESNKVGQSAEANHFNNAIAHWQTQSGTPVFFVSTRHLPIIDVAVEFAAGSAFDPANKAGLASLTHTLLDMGAGKRNENEVADALADIGAELSGALGRDKASITLRSLRREYPAAVSILLDVLAQPQFAENVFKREQRIRVAALKDAMTRPAVMAGMTFARALYGQHPYGNLATPQSIGAIKRQEIVDFHRKFYNADNAFISIVGDLSAEEAHQLGEQISHTLPRGNKAQLSSPPLASTAGDKKIPHAASQAHIHIGQTSVERTHPDYLALTVGNYTFGGGSFMSRLMQEVREKRGLVYSISSGFSAHKNGGAWQISLETKKSQANEATRLVHDMVRDFVRTGPSDDELAAAKQYLIGSFPLHLDNNRKMLAQVANIAFYGLPLDNLQTYQQRVSALSRDEVQQAWARHIKPEQLLTVTVGADTAP